MTRSLEPGVKMVANEVRTGARAACSEGASTHVAKQDLTPNSCFAAGAAKGRSHTETQAGTVKPTAGQQEESEARNTGGVLSALSIFQSTHEPERRG